MLSIFIYILYGRAAKITTVCANNPGTNGFVITIENKIVLWIEFLITFHIRLKHKSFKKPGSMTDMPLRRADICHGLQYIIFRL
ncbi:hypothetical protein BH18ACT7_BH18ACT7_22140 [soil metagenome]